MKLNLKLKDIYIPDWKGNKDLPEDEQIKITFRYITLADREVLSDKNASLMDITKKVWDKNVEKIEGLEMTVDDKSVEFIPSMIYELPDLNELFELTATHVLIASSLSDNEKKN